MVRRLLESDVILLFLHKLSHHPDRLCSCCIRFFFICLFVSPQELFPANKRSCEHFSKYFTDAGLKELSDFARNQQSIGARKELQKELQEQMSRGDPQKEVRRLQGRSSDKVSWFKTTLCNFDHDPLLRKTKPLLVSTSHRTGILVKPVIFYRGKVLWFSSSR